MNAETVRACLILLIVLLAIRKSLIDRSERKRAMVTINRVTRRIGSRK